MLKVLDRAREDTRALSLVEQDGTTLETTVGLRLLPTVAGRRSSVRLHGRLFRQGRQDNRSRDTLRGQRVERLVGTLKHRSEISGCDPLDELVEPGLGDIENMDLAALRPERTEVDGIDTIGRRLAIEKAGHAKQMFRGTHRRLRAVTRSELLDQVLGGIDGKPARHIAGIGSPQQVALLVVLPAVALPDETV